MFLSYLYRPVALADHFQSHSLSVCMDSDSPILDRHYRSWHLLRLIFCWIRKWEKIILGDGQKAAIKGLLEVSIIRANGMVNGH